MGNRIETSLHLLRHPAELGRQMGFTRMTDLHESWALDMLNPNSGDSTLWAHRGSFKTTDVEIVLPICMIKYRMSNIIFMRKTDKDIEEVIKTVLRNLQHPLFRAMYKSLTHDDLQITHANSSEISTSAYGAARGAPQLLGLGIGGSLTGKHADIIFTDDIVNLRDRVSRAERERTKAAYMELQNVRNRGGRIINTGTPWHVDDAFSLMPAPKKFDCYSTGLMSADEIEQVRRSMSPSLFAANYELRHIASENALFPEAAEYQPDAERLYNGIAHVDAAFGGEDGTAFTCGRRYVDKLYLYGRLWNRHVDTCMDEILYECERLRCAPIHVELNADKGYLAKELRRRGAQVQSYTEKSNKYVKISTFLRKWWKSIEWLEGTDAEYIAQIMDYTADAEHDDAPDSAACVCRRLDRGTIDL